MKTYARDMNLGLLISYDDSRYAKRALVIGINGL